MLIDEQVVVVLSGPEFKAFQAIESIIQILPAAGTVARGPSGDMAPSDAKAPRPSCNPRGQSRLSPPPRVATKTNRRKKCDVCGKVFYDNSRTNQRKICDQAECAKELKRRQNEAYRGKIKGGKTSQSASIAPNPADPFLTDEQRKAIMAKREKLIAAAAQKHADL